MSTPGESVATQAKHAGGIAGRLEILLAFGFGAVFCGTLAYLVIRGTPITDPALVFVLRVLTSLSASAVAAVIPGFIDLKLQASTVLGLRAGGAIAVFALVFAANPPELVKSRETQLEAAILANKGAELYDDADRAADDLLQINPRNGIALNAKGSVAFYREEYSKAAEFFERAVAAQPKPAWISNLAYAYIETGAYEKAIAKLETINDGKPDWSFSIGRAYLYAGDYKRARTELQATPTSFWKGAGRVLEAAALVALSETAAAAEREQLITQAKAKLADGFHQDTQYWRDILTGTRKDIHMSYNQPIKLLQPILAAALN